MCTDDSEQVVFDFAPPPSLTAGERLRYALILLTISYPLFRLKKV